MTYDHDRNWIRPDVVCAIQRHTCTPRQLSSCDTRADINLFGWLGACVVDCIANKMNFVHLSGVPGPICSQNWPQGSLAS